MEPIVIEQNLTDEEQFLIEQGMAEYERNPNSFIPLHEVK